uniref:Hypothetical conserved protein n=1 Tax=Acetithermum autotrophicum TaxID=1446466 RepID=H5SRG3_ACEAU|nr:hypothetical conserved protein [Candidatus Acetothermum autotrophicum]
MKKASKVRSKEMLEEYDFSKGVRGKYAKQYASRRYVMLSKLWHQPLEEVRQKPYDYIAQEQFLREARILLNKLLEAFARYNLTFHVDDRSLKKAVWMLQMDALETLRDCVWLIEQKKHRIVGKMFRDIVESLDLAALFYHQGEANRKDLDKWYNDEIIPHKRYRDYLNPDDSEARKYLYQQLSNWTHHTYSTLKNSYVLGRDNLLVHDSTSRDVNSTLEHGGLLGTPQTISEYMWMIATLIKMFIEKALCCGLILQEDMQNIWNDLSIEAPL